VAERPIETQVLGLPELKKGSRKLFDRIGEHADKEFQSTADQVATLVAAKQPVKTGRLRASVSTTGIEHGAQIGLGGPGVPYAGWIEFGGTRGRPYVDTGRTLYPTAEDSERLFERAGERVARDQIGVMFWPKPNKP
jgi:phage gpG-like protein